MRDVRDGGRSSALELRSEFRREMMDAYEHNNFREAFACVYRTRPLLLLLLLLVACSCPSEELHEHRNLGV